MMWKCDFTFRHYFEVLNYATKEYSIGPVRDFYDLRKKSKYVMLRHDVDYSLGGALKMAKEEFNHGLRSTYFILLHSPYYNALSENNVSLIKQISSLGHEIGLHYDTTFISLSDKKAVKQIEMEAKILSDIADQEVSSISQHNVTITPQIKASICSKFFDMKHSEITNETTYISDSVQNWRQGCMCRHIGKIPRLHILTHPIWWGKYSKSRHDIMEGFEKITIKKFHSDVSHARKLHTVYFKKLRQGD
jgi:hypothetical protein